MFILVSPVDEVLDAAGIRRLGSDFKWTDDGEMLSFNPAVCDNWKVSGKCGCERAFVGLDSAKATTLAIVGECNSKEALVKIISSNMASEMKDWLPINDLVEMAAELHHEIRASGFKVGDVVRALWDTSRLIQLVIKA